MLQKKYPDSQITQIRNQAIVYQCDCPGQVCVAIDDIRQLHEYQARCLDQGPTDQAVHLRIKRAAEIVHGELEDCLTEVLILEGWNMQTLEMPANLRKRLLGDPVANLAKDGESA